MKNRSVFSKMSPWIVGVLGAGLLLAVYFTILSIANTPSYAVNQFKSLWYWFLPLIIGFGVQLGLYAYIKRYEHDKLYGIGASVAASSGVSAGAMIACCLHHIGDLLPILGLSAAALFLIRYQIPFIILGIASSAVGITMMLVLMQEHGLYHENGHIAGLFKVNMKAVRRIVLIFGMGVTFMSFIITMNKGYL